MEMPGNPAGEQPASGVRAGGPKEKEKCDLIMKGGVTSGIVYPAAVAALHPKYDFRSVGGASAGAIAASLTAAAQYAQNRERGGRGSGGGFEALADASKEIASPGVLRSLFQPSRRAAWLFNAFLGLQEARGALGKVGVLLGVVVRRFAVQVLVSAAVAFGAVAAVLWGFGGSLGKASWGGWLVLSLLLLGAAALGLVVAVIARVWRTLRSLPGNFYGVCRGMPEGRRPRPALTPWLHQQIQRCAGRADADPPLTFADLAGEQITLQVMTTDLSAARPYRLPFGDDGQFLYRRSEFERLFPSDVITYLDTVSTTAPGGPDGPGGHDLRTLPGSRLPVIVATRMSLSLPVLLSAVPLWQAADNSGGEPVCHWFSDGGIASNFPMHFFDAWLPTRPTFGLDLVPASRAAGPTTGISPHPARQTAPISSLFGFLHQVLDTMQNWRDSLQAELPGFRERVQPIFLEADEGGMNITMPPETIERLAQRGKGAGESLLRSFRWDDHVFARFTLLMRLLQQNLAGADGTTPVSEAFTTDFEQDLAAGMPSVTEGRDAYSDQWCASASVQTNALLDLAKTWAYNPLSSFIQGEDPIPGPVMRTGPKV
jgi:predicted acylesterase/phospholipase RssA